MGTAQSKTDDHAETLTKLYDKQIQRELVLAEELFTAKQALDKARLREAMFWEILATGTVALTTLFYSLKTKNRLVPVFAVPALTIACYHGEMCTTDFNKRVRKEAERILSSPKERKYVQPIGGPITLAELDERRKRWSTINKTLPQIENLSTLSG